MFLYDGVEKAQKEGMRNVWKISQMKVSELQKTSQIYDKMTFEGEISWRYSGKNGSFSHKDAYQIGVVKDVSEYRLISFEIQ